MGRPSKLAESQWTEIIARVSRGESQSDLAKEYGVSKATVSKRVSKPAEERKQRVEAVANQLVTAETALKALDVSEQTDAMRMRDDLLATSRHILRASTNGAAIASRLSSLAAVEMDKIDDADPGASVGTIKTIGVLMNVAKEASHIPLSLLSANKDWASKVPSDPTTDGQGRPKVPNLTRDPAEATQRYLAFVQGG